MTHDTVPSFTASVPTERASRYMQQLAKHWAHKLDVHFDSERATVTFPIARLDMVADTETLALTLVPTGDEDISHLKDVVEKHLDRFAFREGELVYDWQSMSV